MTPEILAELERFDAEFTPQSVKRAGLESLEDGEYVFEITAADLEKTAKSGDLILRQLLKVIGGKHDGLTVEHVYFFKSQQNIDILGSDLCTLGFDADQWNAPSRPFSKELVAVLPKLKGIRFKGKKVTKDSKYHNLYINARLAANSITPPPPAAYVENPQEPIPF